MGNMAYRDLSAPPGYPRTACHPACPRPLGDRNPDGVFSHRDAFGVVGMKWPRRDGYAKGSPFAWDRSANPGRHKPRRDKPRRGRRDACAIVVSSTQHPASPHSIFNISHSHHFIHPFGGFGKVEAAGDVCAVMWLHMYVSPVLMNL